MEAAVRFQAQEQIPMPLDQAVLEHQVVGGVAAEEGAAAQVDVVVVAARRDMVASFVEPIRRAGLEPVGVDLSAFAMIRALADAGARAEQVGEPAERPPGAVLYCNLGDVTNLAVARGNSCLFTRVSHAGLEAISARLAALRAAWPPSTPRSGSPTSASSTGRGDRGRPRDVAEARRALEEGVDTLLDELRLSLDYYGAQETALPVERSSSAARAARSPASPRAMEAGLGLPRSPLPGPPALAGFDEPSAARLTLPYGLALED